MRTRKSLFIRSIAVIMTAILLASGSIVFTGTAYAASSTKTFVVPKKITTKYVYEDGEKNTQTYTLGYDSKTGLQKYLKVAGYDAKWTYGRNSNGDITGISYYFDGKKQSYGTAAAYKYDKKGRVTQEKNYYKNGSKKTLMFTKKYKYTSKGKISKEIYTDAGGAKTTTYYRTNGNPEKEVTVDGKYKNTTKYDKKGNPVSAVSKKTSNGKTKVESSITYDNTYDKKTGELTKVIETAKIGSDVSTTTYTYTRTYYTSGTYKGQLKSLKTKITTVTSDDEKYTQSETQTYKYTKVKLKKKYWRQIDKLETTGRA